MSSDSPPAPEPPSARDRILAVAGRLFYRDGYRAIGVDRVIGEAEVAKATFYKHFPSKDDLIAGGAVAGGRA
jgi:AcrR family transcriptional regulator